MEVCKSLFIHLPLNHSCIIIFVRQHFEVIDVVPGNRISYFAQYRRHSGFVIICWDQHRVTEGGWKTMDDMALYVLYHSNWTLHLMTDMSLDIPVSGT